VHASAHAHTLRAEQAKSAKTSADKAIADRELQELVQLNEARRELGSSTKNVTLAQFRKMRDGAGGYTGPGEERKWWCVERAPFLFANMR
jgi:hypothetical protein